MEDEYGLHPNDDAIYEAFTEWAESTGRPLYEHQEEALLGALEAGAIHPRRWEHFRAIRSEIAEARRLNPGW